MRMGDNDRDKPPPPSPQRQTPWDQQPWGPPPMPRRNTNALLYDQSSPAVPFPTEIMKAETGMFTVSGGAADLGVIRLPFNEAAMAERLAADPEFYRRLAAHGASELRAYAASINTSGQDNVAVVVKGEVTEIADGFDQVAATLTTQDGILTPQAAAKAAAIVSKIRNAYAALCTDHPELLKIAKICFAGMALYQFGHAPEGWAGLIAYAVIEKVRLSDFIKTKKGE